MVRRRIDTYKTDGVIFEGDLNTARGFYNNYVKQNDYWKKTKKLRTILLTISFLPPILILLTFKFDIIEDFYLYFMTAPIFFIIGFLLLYYLPTYNIKKKCTKDIHGYICPDICITDDSISFLYTRVTPVDHHTGQSNGPDIAVDEKITFNKVQHVIYDNRFKTLEIKGNYYKIEHAGYYSNSGNSRGVKGEHNTRKIFLAHKGRDIILNMLVEKLGNKMTFI